MLGSPIQPIRQQFVIFLNFHVFAYWLSNIQPIGKDMKIQKDDELLTNLLGMGVRGELPTLGIYNTDKHYASVTRDWPTITRQLINAARYERNIMHKI